MYDLNLLLPDISAKKYSNDDKFRLLKNYLIELNDTLCYALSTVDNGETIREIKNEIKEFGNSEVNPKKLKEEIAGRFAQLKSDIIRTAEEIEQNYTSAIEVSEREILQTVSSGYTARSEFGAYRSDADTRIQQNAADIGINARNIENIDNDLESYKISNNAGISVFGDTIISEVESIYAKKRDVDELNENISSRITQTATDIVENFSEDVTKMTEDISTVGENMSEFISSIDVYIRRGELESGVYGIEIGRSDSEIKARFTNDRLSFFQGNTEVAYISGNNLYITRAQVLDYLEIGNGTDGYFTFDVTGNGLEVRWLYGN